MLWGRGGLASVKPGKWEGVELTGRRGEQTAGVRPTGRERGAGGGSGTHGQERGSSLGLRLPSSTEGLMSETGDMCERRKFVRNFSPHIQVFRFRQKRVYGG